MKKKSKTPVIIGGVVVVLLLVAAALLVPKLLKSDDDGPGAIALEPASSPGREAFSDTSFATAPDPALAQGPATGSAASPSGSVTVATKKGDEKDLYGGTKTMSPCDAPQLVAFLAADADKAAVWVQALNDDSELRWDKSPLVAADIKTYVDTLTPVVLLKDTRVTTNGFDAKAKPAVVRQAVLQKGSGVLVDKFGTPRVRCASGNPLIAPKPASAKPEYLGDAWVDFAPGSLTAVTAADQPIVTFTLKDTAGGASFSRPVGPTAANDADGVAAADPSLLVRHDGGAFEVEKPAGWEAQTSEMSKLATDAPIIRLSKTIDDYLANGDVAGLSVTDLTKSSMTPEAFFEQAAPDDSQSACANFSAAPQPYSEAGFTGSIGKIGPCPEGEFRAYDGEYWRIAATRADGAKVAISAVVGDPSVEPALKRVLETFKTN